MKPTHPRILSVNGGSSSLKFALFESIGGVRQVLTGEIERIGLAGTALRTSGPDDADRSSQPLKAPDHTSAVAALIEWLEAHDHIKTLSAIGHRIVHGGPKYSEPTLLTPEIVATIRSLIPFDPPHLPQEILMIEAFRHKFPDLPQVACFDTAFFHDLPRVAQLLPIPRRFEAQGVRRYGFHGISYAFLMEELMRQAGEAKSRGRVILAHLGNGASLAAVHDRKPVDTSMAFTPASGVPMGSRCGNIDPGLVSYFAHTENMSPRQFDHMINFQSGLFGMSEISSDMRELLDCEARDVRAAEAVAVFCHEIKKAVGGFAASLGGVDQLVFSGGIGENAPQVRERICHGLEFLGIKLNTKRNAVNATVISADTGSIDVRVIHTDEELMIAKTVAQILDLNNDTTD